MGRRTAMTRRFARDERAAAVVEFALVLPVLLLFALGVTEVGRLALLAIKLQHAATAIADLASRLPDEQLTRATLNDLFDAAEHILEPFDVAAEGVAIVSGVETNGGGSATVLWQERGAGSLAAASGIGRKGGSAALPSELLSRSGEIVIVAELFFHYRAWLLGVVPESMLRRVAFFRPRLGTLRQVL